MSARHVGTADQMGQQTLAVPVGQGAVDVRRAQLSEFGAAGPPDHETRAPSTSTPR